MDLQTVWYCVIGLSMIMYTVLDGFDLGVGTLHLFAKNDYQRRIFLNAIGPVWDGNEVWIVIIVGALLAGFPAAYGTILSGFYPLIMFLLAGFIFRAVAIEFRSKSESKKWRQTWDVAFWLSSHTVAFVIGLILGNLIEGIPLNEQNDYIGTFADMFRPYSILIGFTGVSLFAMHGAIYLAMKTEGETHEVVRSWINGSILVFALFYTAATIETILHRPHMTDAMREYPLLMVIPFLALAAILNIPRQIKKQNDGWAFLSSCASISLLIGLFGIGTYPFLVKSTVNEELNSLTIYNAASTPKTLGVLLIIVGIGIPLVLAYGTMVYRIFRGKVKLEDMSY